MKAVRLAAAPVLLAALVLASCKSDSSTGPSNNLGAITCAAADQSVCPPANLVLGFNGGTGTPSITPAQSSTSWSVSSSAYTAVGATNSTANGYWFIVINNQLRAWGIITVASGAYAADIPLFCGQQALIYRFDNASGHSYWYAGATLTNCSVAAFRAQLTWDTGPSSSDIDLHLVRPSGTMFSTNDCYYGNCKLSITPTGLEWGATGAAGNPSLDVDNTEGYGPENITLVSGAEAGNYAVVIDNFDGVLATHATVKIYFNDQEVYRNTSLALDYSLNHEYWYVANVNIQTQSVTPVNTYSAAQPLAPGVRPVAAHPAK